MSIRRLLLLLLPVSPLLTSKWWIYVTTIVGLLSPVSGLVPFPFPFNHSQIHNLQQTGREENNKSRIQLGNSHNFIIN